MTNTPSVDVRKWTVTGRNVQVGEMYNKAHQFQGQKLEGQGHHAD